MMAFAQGTQEEHKREHCLYRDGQGLYKGQALLALEGHLMTEARADPCEPAAARADHVGFEKNILQCCPSSTTCFHIQTQNAPPRRPRLPRSPSPSPGAGAGH